PGRSLASHQKRAGLGVWAVNRAEPDREVIKAWKQAAPFDPEGRAGFASSVAELVRAWSPILPAGTIVTVPPPGASAPRPSAAEALGQAVAGILGLPFSAILERTDAKRWHGPHHSLRQAAFVCTLPEPAPAMVLVIDDLITSGRTMRLSIEALRAAGV